MSVADTPQPRSGDTNNLSGVPVSTWEDERRDVTSFVRLSSQSKEDFLLMVGFLFGFRIDFNSGPRRAASRVAVLKSAGEACFREASGLDTENIITQNKRDTNYVRQGWSLSPLSQASPWAQSRIANNNQTHCSEESITKRIVACRLQVDVLLQDLSPAPEFETEVKAALGLSTRFETFQALYRVFERWGDLIPLSFDVGASLTIVDRNSDNEAYSTHLSNFEIMKMMGQKTTMVSARGFDLSIPQGGARYGLCDSEIPVGRWSQIRVTKAAPVTALLSSEIQKQLSRLYRSLITYRPQSFDGDTCDGCAFDDVTYSLKTIKSITVYSTDRVNAICVAYSDGTCAPRRGAKKGSASSFDLDIGEYISEVHIWGDSTVISSIQFLTTAGRMSYPYGGSSGRPMIMKDTGGLLVAFAGKIKGDILYQLKGIWRHDIQQAEPSEERRYSDFYGTKGGGRFSDLPLLKDLNATISKIKVRSSNRINAIQVTYVQREGDRAVTVEGAQHGEAKNSEGAFELAPGEYITTVRGRADPFIIQLCFATNLGRTSSIFGGGEGTEFTCQAPLDRNGKTMRLYSVLGRRGALVDGLVFVWVVV